MVKKYPDLERGESASETGRDHIPTRVFKQMARLNKQHDKLAELLSDMKFTNYKERSAQIAAFLEKYIPDVAAMETQMKKYEKFFKTADVPRQTVRPAKTLILVRSSRIPDGHSLRKRKPVQ